ncbi:hypothetical protein [Pedobacter sp. ASV28]|nr:hypothetical protein [Pedobacter sp. ASV28]
MLSPERALLLRATVALLVASYTLLLPVAETIRANDVMSAVVLAVVLNV